MENKVNQPAQQPVVVKTGNGMGVAGFVLALLGLIFCWVPVIDWILWLLGVIFSVIGVFKPKKGLAIAGLVISFIGILVIFFLLGSLF